MMLLPFRTVFEIDFHQLAAGRELWIGTIKSDHHQGADGHNGADVLDSELKNISIKATTSEKMGFAGREKEIAAYATDLIYANNNCSFAQDLFKSIGNNE